MQAIMETLFDAAYLVTVVTLGCIMVKSAQDRETKLFGWMAVILGCGDAFHLVPRAWALCTDGLAAHAAALGAGKFITSITMILRYSLPYWKTALWPAHPGADGRRIRAGRGTHRIVPVPAECVAFGELAAVLGHLAQRSVRTAGRAGHRGIPARRAADGGQGLPLDVAGHRAQLRVLYPGGAVGRRRSARGHAHDPQDLRLCVGGLDGLFGYAS